MFKTIKNLWVFQTTQDCDLCPADQLAYAALARKDMYAQKWTVKGLAFACGMDERTMKRALDRLAGEGYIKDGKPVFRPDMFRIRAHVTEGHWYKRMYHWDYLVPEPGKIRIQDAFVYSFLLHHYLKKWAPTGGWSPAYIAARCRIDQRTVESIFERLGAFRMARFKEGKLHMEDELNFDQRSLFQAKGQKPTKNEAPVITMCKWSDDPSSPSEFLSETIVTPASMMETRIAPQPVFGYAHVALVDWLKAKGCSDPSGTTKKLYLRNKDKPDFETRWLEYIEEDYDLFNKEVTHADRPTSENGGNGDRGICPSHSEQATDQPTV